VILRDFSGGRKNALVAIRCLDEGIDIPQVRRAFILASSTNPRQFIQRRGRVLRRAEGKDSAEIFDFVVVPPLDEIAQGTSEYTVLRRLVSREMARVVEFARLAENGPQAQAKLLPMLSKLRLMHL
jgi:superfamily II DNA or RNA helicase